MGRDSYLGSNPASARSSFLLGANLNATSGVRKDMPITPNQKMKQLQWDKLPHQQVTNTLWQEEAPTKEKEMIAKLSSDGIWLEMEADFQAKQLVINLLGVLQSPKATSAFPLIAFCHR
jgi:cytokinesis protein